MVLIAGDHHPGYSGFGDGDGYGWGTGGGWGEADEPLSMWEEDPFCKPAPGVPYEILLNGDGRGYGPRGLRCPEYQFTTTRSFNGHLTNIFLRGLPS